MKNNLLFKVSATMLGLTTLSAIIAQNRSKKDEHPNVLFILADDLGYGDLPSYGNQYVQTPHIDQLVKRGTMFTQCYAGSAVSSPSRCALMTGKHSGRGTIRDNFCKVGGIEGKKGATTIRRIHLSENDTTIADMMRREGYRTCLVNKWHLDGFNANAGPLDRGFDEFYGWLISTEDSNAPYYYPQKRFINREIQPITANLNDLHIRHNNDISADDAVAFLDRNKNNPFFLYLAFDAPHEPYIIDETTWYDNRNWDEKSKKYASLITHMDRAIGRVLAKLDEMGERENTIVFFASDNGAATMAPFDLLSCGGVLRGTKGRMYEGGIRVPFIVSWPGKVKENHKVTQPIYFPDVMPTMAAMCGAKAPKQIDGIDVSPLFYGKRMNTSDRLMYWEFPGTQMAARRGDWKVVKPSAKAPIELYNLKKDVSERDNLADRYPEKIEQFKREIKQTRKPSPNWPLADD